MKKILPFFLSLVVIIYNILPTFTIKADTMPTNQQYEMLGAYAFSELLRSGEATELDFSDYVSSDGNLLLALGEAIFTGDFSGLVSIGLDWLDDTVISAYDTLKQGIREWEYSIAPNLYEAWYGSTPFQNSLKLSDAYKIGKELRGLFTPSNNLVDIPQDYSFIQHINDYYISRYPEQDFISIYDVNDFYYSNKNNLYHPVVPTYAVSEITDTSTIHYADQYNNGGKSIFNQGIISINITEQNNLWYVFYNNVNYYSLSGYFPGYNNNYYIGGYSYLSTYQGITYNGAFITPNSGSFNFTTNQFNTLYDALIYIFSHYANINLYVNGEQWISSRNVNYPIELPGILTIWDGQQLSYEFPDNTYVDLSQLTPIIRNAINGSDVVHWSDIEDTYIDINGQQVVATTHIYRNDDDNLYVEQYQDITLPKFDHNQISVLGNYVDPVTNVVEESTDVLPTELVTLFKVAVILMLFACIVHRLLE